MEIPRTATIHASETEADEIRGFDRPRAVAAESDHYRGIFENAVVGIYQTTVDGSYLRVNRALAGIYGYQDPADLTESLTDIARQLYFDPADRTRFTEIIAERGVVDNFEAQIYRKDGSVIWIRETARCVRDTDGKIRFYEGMVEDISARKQAEDKIRQLATVFENIDEGILIIDRDLVVRAANPAFEKITGQIRDVTVGRPVMLVAPEYHDKNFLNRVFTEAAAGERWQGEATCLHKGRDFFPAALSMSAVRNPSGTVEHFVLVCTDLTQRRQHEERIRHQANYDSLTGLPNRWLIRDRLDQAIARATRHRDRVAVAFLDLDRFKQVNDSLGHRFGDELLRQVAQRLRNMLRLSDTVGRFGGDEYIVIAPDLAERSTGVQIAHKIAYAFSEPFDLDRHDYFITPSIGISFFPDDGDNAETLIRNADLAMYHAKLNKPRRFSLYSSEMRRKSEQRLHLENDLRMAVVREEFVLHYQPKVNLATGRMIGAEALVRWNHPKLGLVAPGRFIPTAEETGLISAIGYWTLRRACRQLQQWRGAGLRIESVSVNLSPRQFNDALLISVISQILAESGLAPHRLELELTEGAMIADLDRAVTTLEGLKELGVRLAIDDFGTGYSSLSYLKRFPIDCLKIDRSFVHDLDTSATDAAIVETIIGMAASLGFSVVAEGVETVRQAEMLRDRGCLQLQGFLISRPIDAAAFTNFLIRWPEQLPIIPSPL